MSIARDGGAVTKLRAYLPGVGQEEEGTTSQPAYAHADQIGSTRLMTDANAAIVRHQIYFAFGERITTDGTQPTRYQYAGAWGYERMTFPASQPNGSPIEIPFIHVGERWYDPEYGRFLQRDPVGIEDDINTYAYVSANPISSVDPSGNGVWKLLYTGNWSASDSDYNSCVAAAGDYFYEHSPVRGGYVGAGTKSNRGVALGGGAAWSVDDGGFGYFAAGYGCSRRGLDMNKHRFCSNTFGFGVAGTIGSNGVSISPFAGGGSNEKKRGTTAAAGGGQSWIGVNFGVFQAGIIVDLGRILP